MTKPSKTEILLAVAVRVIAGLVPSIALAASLAVLS